MSRATGLGPQGDARRARGRAGRAAAVAAVGLVGLVGLGGVWGSMSAPAGAADPAAGASAARAGMVDAPEAQRVLVFSVPGLEWRDVRAERMPNLVALRDRGGIGLLSTRIGNARASLGDAYLTIGAGTRAVSTDSDGGLAYERDEPVAGTNAAERYRQATGRRTAAAVVHLSIDRLAAANESSPFDAQPGMLGSALARAGVARAVIANGDRNEVPADVATFRAAVAALMDTRGRLTGGSVARDLLRVDPLAPFGLRFADGAVEEAFGRWWPRAGTRGVVLVEASDAYRAARSLPKATPARAEIVRDRSLGAADALLGRLLRRVDPARDAVLVLGIPVPTSRPSLGVVALAAPGWDAGRLLSASTRRAGYLTLADVAPTVLALAGARSGTAIEGESAYLDRGGAQGWPAQRDLERSVEAAAFRSDALAVFMTSLGLVTAVVFGLECLRRRRGLARVRGAGPLAKAVLAVIAASFLSAMWVDAQSRAGPFVVTLLGLAAGLLLTAVLADRVRPGAGGMFLLTVIAAVIAVDLACGAPLQLNTMFGYSAEVGGRFAGLGNLAYALFAPACLLGAVMLARLGSGRPVRVAVMVVFVAAVLIDGLPYLGADVGGVVSMVPAFALTYWILTASPVTAPRVAGALLATGATVVVFGFLDLARPERERAHLARLAQQVRDSGPKWLVTTVARRWAGSFGGPVVSLVVLAVLVAALVVAALVGRRLLRRARAAGRPLHVPSWFPREPEPRALVVGLTVLGVLGLFANDSSVAVPGVMLFVIVCGVVACGPAPRSETS